MEVSVLKVREEGIYPVFTPYLAPGPALSTPTYVRICAPHPTPPHPPAPFSLSHNFTRSPFISKGAPEIANPLIL